MNKKFVFLVGCLMIVSGVCLSRGYCYAADETEPQDSIGVNDNLKNAIEENQLLLNKNKALEEELRLLKDEKVLKEKQYQEMKKDRDSLVSDIQKVKQENREYVQKVKDSQKSSSTAAADTSRQQAQADESGVGDVPKIQAGVTSKEIEEMENKTVDLLSKIDVFAEQDEALKADAARAHYNMGNVYFQKGEYEFAVREFYQASILMPNDPDVHYNLAYVSGDYLDDYVTALKHYQMYLYLSPNAQDIKAVHEKIIEAKLKLRAKTDSVLEKKKK